ncbi:hypothetical protein [Neptunomonas qingdaonensis]|uniref:Uncharacterized protein n=1 Tax=Neptunomonas qingdaonensis TaxID=1045558 RepID=A0A1I2LTH5_9GAMM|nr:hypothetical protein [Neptunomonas qingdaonensis]SFF80767.1 hypothetical protein SAMN05216175_101147 [Neptunomonas qingdaonensis]
MDTKSALIQEWTILQTQADTYEKHALYIKLMSIGLVSAALLLNQTGFGIIALLSVLWLLEAIWKTFQSRITERLLTVEGALKVKPDPNDTQLVSPCQLNAEWLAHRQGFAGLIGEYLSQAIRPTVAFPHVLLIAGVCVVYVS